MEDSADYETTLEEEIFHNHVRQRIIILLLFILLYILSFAILKSFKRSDDEDYYSTDDEEIVVFRISTWLCTFSLAVSIGAVLLLPISIISNEVLMIYSDSYYIKWLNSSLIQGLWNYIFIFSNASLFIMLPFAYLFTESEGFLRTRRRLAARVQATILEMVLMGVVIVGLTCVLCSLFGDNHFKQSFYSWTYCLPFLYSIISFFGVLVLLICTPLGFAKLFDVVYPYFEKPHFLSYLNEKYQLYKMEEESVRRQLRDIELPKGLREFRNSLQMTNGYHPVITSHYSIKKDTIRRKLRSKLGRIVLQLEAIDNQRKRSFVRRNMLNPFAMAVLLTLTVTTILMVVRNTLSLLIGIKAFPITSKQFTLGVNSLSKLGPFGAALEVVLIIYLTATSLVGLYTMPVVTRIRPCFNSTPFCIIIANCALILILSSALPLLSKILGITNFDLLEDFARIEWLGNFEVVLLYNVAFAITATGYLFNKLTVQVRRELTTRLFSKIFSLPTILLAD